MIRILISIFHISILFLIVISLWPGSLLGYLFYGDWGQQPDLIQNPFGTIINHFLYYLYVSLLGFYVYLKTKNFKKLVYGLFFFINNSRAISSYNTKSIFSARRLNRKYSRSNSCLFCNKDLFIL